MAALSARALSQSARAGGYRPLAADLFGDLDTRAAAERTEVVEGDLARGFEWEALERALCALSEGRAPIGIVCGSGFEDRAAMLDRLAARWPLLGNSADSVRRVKDPASLAALCGACGIPHPRWSGEPRDGWLSKRIGGAGGAHVAGGSEAQRYWQEPVAGEPVSVLVLGDGREAMALGLSGQWADPAPGAPYRYGGAVRPAARAAGLADDLADAARRLVAAARLVGLNSVDFLAGPGGFHLIEVNPRPGATLDIFRPREGSLFALHVEACRGNLPAEAPGFPGAAAARIVYARRAVASVPALDWPDWAMDRQPPGTTVDAGAPLCTVCAETETPAGARRLVDERAGAIAAALEAAP